MNKELEEAIKICNDFVEENKSRKIILHKAIEIVLEALKNYQEKYNFYLKVCNESEKDLRNILENSIPKEVIEKKIEELQEKLKHYEEYSKLNMLEKINVDIVDCKIAILQELFEEK